VKVLQSKIKSKKSSKNLRSRCQILLALDEAHGKSLTLVQCAKSIGVCKATVSNTIKDYADAGFNQAITYNRNVNSDNARRKLDGRAEAKIIQIACGPVPEGHSRWTLRLLEEKAKVELEIPINKETIRTALKKTNFDLTATAIGASLQKKMQDS